MLDFGSMRVKLHPGKHDVHVVGPIGFSGCWVLHVGCGTFGHAWPCFGPHSSNLLFLVLPNPENYPNAEERRLMYVAMTRAVEQLFVVTQKKLDRYGQENLQFYSGIFISFLKETK